jgi:replicative DNA helicase
MEISTMIELKTPPHSVEAEQAVIGSVLTQALTLVDIDLSAGMFYRKEHQAIWAAMLSLFDARKPIDTLTVMETLVDSDKLAIAGGIEYLAEVAGAGSSYNTAHYAEIVRSRYLERRLIGAGQSIAGIGYETGDIEEKLAKARGLMADLQTTESDEATSISDCLRESICALEKRYDRKGEIDGMKTGYVDLDSQLMGIQNGDLVIVAGRPSMGKTTLAMNIAENIAMAGELVIVFSLEMPKRKLADRMVCSVGKVPYRNFKNGDLDNEQWDRCLSATVRLKTKTLYIDDKSTLTSRQMLSRARRIAHKLNLKPALVVVDYLQLLTDKGEGVGRITEISRNLKLTAKELDCPLIAISQLSRKCEERSDKRPLMSDLRESGAIEQDADIIAMVYRDEQYNQNTEWKGIAEVIVCKARDGETGTVFMSAALDRCRFESLAHQNIPRPKEETQKQRRSFYDS